jgi:hypothetical protein
MGEAGRARARAAFSQERMLDQLADVYADVLSREGRRGRKA